jgi:hypothetical protein
VRSGVVHGSRRKRKDLSVNLLDGVDRLFTLVLLRLAGNAEMWPAREDLNAWFERERWGSPQPLSPAANRTHLLHALRLATPEPPSKTVRADRSETSDSAGGRLG